MQENDLHGLPAACLQVTHHLRAAPDAGRSTDHVKADSRGRPRDQLVGDVTYVKTMGWVRSTWPL